MMTWLQRAARVAVICASIAGLFVSVTSAIAAEPARDVKQALSAKTFPSLHTLVRPQADEWRHLRVNWLTDVVTARRTAAATDKPIVILYTGGAGYNEPLGTC